MTDREQLIDVMMRALCEHHHGQGSATCDEEQEGDSYVREEMYAILAEIEAAGKVIMDRDRAIRMQQSHSQRYTEAVRLTAGMPDGTTAKYFDGWYQPGDLDPLEGGE